MMMMMMMTVLLGEWLWQVDMPLNKETKPNQTKTV